MDFREQWARLIATAKQKKLGQKEITRRAGLRSRQFLQDGKKNPAALSLDTILGAAKAVGLSEIETERLCYAWVRERMIDDEWSKALLLGMEEAAKAGGSDWEERVRRAFLRAYVEANPSRAER